MGEGGGIIPALSPYVGTGFLVCIRKFLFYLKTKGDFVSILVTEGKYFRNISFLRKVSKKIKQNLWLWQSLNLACRHRGVMSPTSGPSSVHKFPWVLILNSRYFMHRTWAACVLPITLGIYAFLFLLFASTNRCTCVTDLTLKVQKFI